MTLGPRMATDKKLLEKPFWLGHQSEVPSGWGLRRLLGALNRAHKRGWFERVTRDGVPDLYMRTMAGLRRLQEMEALDVATTSKGDLAKTTWKCRACCQQNSTFNRRCDCGAWKS